MVNGFLFLNDPCKAQSEIRIKQGFPSCRPNKKWASKLLLELLISYRESIVSKPFEAAIHLLSTSKVADFICRIAPGATAEETRASHYTTHSIASSRPVVLPPFQPGFTPAPAPARSQLPLDLARFPASRVRGSPGSAATPVGPPYRLP